MTSIDPTIEKEASPPVEAQRPSTKTVAHCTWLPARCRCVPPRFAELALLRLTLLANTRGGTCHQLAPRGRLKIPIGDLLQELRADGFRLLRCADVNAAESPYGDFDVYLGRRAETGIILVHPSGYVEVDPRSRRPILVFSVDDRQAEHLRARLGAWMRPSFDEDAGVIYMLKAEPDEVGFMQIGTAGKPLRKENYSAATLRELDHVAHDVEAADPCGRLIVLTGPAGTGKTHLIRSLLAAAKRPRFIVAQPGDLGTMLAAGPLAALADFARDEAQGRPIVLVIEDADDCLVPRGSDNMSLIAALLNLSDGIVGSAFDIRVLVTTNAKHTEMDPAILRAGRLCRRVDVPPLPPDHANGLLRSLLGAEPLSPYRVPVTLAEVYATAHDAREATREGGVTGPRATP